MAVGVAETVRPAISAGLAVSVVVVLPNDDSCEKFGPPESDSGSGAKFAGVDRVTFESGAAV
ncbi:MAG TPA: hypothetical protein VJW93_15085 [Candidatus Acidoferrales bacterium]|nr:hypothetical protein [Candidatus Acidoferrales bacterium]